MKFNITVQGKNITVDAPNRSVLPQFVDKIVKSQEFQNVPAIEQPKEIPGLPDIQKTEKEISERPSSLEAAKETLTAPASIQDLKTPGSRVLKAGVQAAGGVLERGEAAVAAPLLALQKGEPKEVGREFVKGITGKKLAQFGDPIRAAGVGKGVPIIGGDLLNEAIASTVGLGVTLGVGALLSKGKLIKASRKAEQALKGARSIKAENRARFFTQRGTRLRSAVEDLLGGVKKEFDNLYNKVKGIGANPVSPQEQALAQEFLERQSPATLSRYNRTIGKKTGVKLGEKTKTSKILTQKGKPVVEGGKAIPPKDISEVKALKDIISDSVPDKVWSGAEKASQAEAIAMGDVRELADIIANNAGASKGKLLALNDRFSKLSKFRTQIQSITSKSKDIKKATTLKNIRKIGQEGELEILTNFSKEFFPETEQILREIDRFNRFEKIGKFGKAVVSPANITRLGIIGALKGAKGAGGGGSTTTGPVQ